MKKIIFTTLAFVFFISISANQVFAKSLKGTLTDLMLKGQSLKCTYSMKVNENSIKGTIYTSNKKFRTEFKIPYLDKKNSTAYTLSDGKNLYMWNSAVKTGTKMNIKKMETLGKGETNNQEAQKTAIEMQKKYKYNCSAWKAPMNFFKVPKNINFTDMTEMMEGLKGLGDKMKKGAANLQNDSCSICNSLPAAVKQQCLDNCK
jgi:hypothetical protein